MSEQSHSQQFIDPLMLEVRRLRWALLGLGGMVVVLAAALIVVTTQLSDGENSVISLAQDSRIEPDPPAPETRVQTATNLEQAIKPQAPLGFRTVTIGLDPFATQNEAIGPKSNVDIIWSYTEKGEPKLRKIVSNAKVLSVGETNEATLLLREEEGKIVELARGLGKLNLSLAGKEDFLLPDPWKSPEAKLAKATMPEPSPSESDIAKEKLGLLEMLDSKSGKFVSFKLVNGSWQKADEDSNSALSDQQALPRTVSSFQPDYSNLNWNPIGLIVKDE